MAKELPYFRFTASEWLNDDISLESYELKGLFIDICAYYWSNDCDVTLIKLKKRFSNATILLEQLLISDIIKHENRHDKIIIDFLMTQYDLLSEKRKVRQVAGSKGGNAKAMLKQKPSYKDKDNNNNKDNKRKSIKIKFEESLFLDKVKFKDAMPSDWSKIKLAYYYDAALRYSKEGNKYVEWNTAVIAWAKKDEIQGKINFVSKSVPQGLQFL